VANRLLSAAEVAESVKTELDKVIVDFNLTGDEVRELLNCLSLSMGGPGVERPSHSAASDT
jgi:hypothetical protein